MKFKDLNLISPILKAVDLQGYVVPTPIQEKAIPIILQGRDLIGCAQTGTGKTAAFAIPILQSLYNEKQVSAMPSSDVSAAAYAPKTDRFSSKPLLPVRPGFGGRRTAGNPATPSPVKVLVMTPTRELAIQIGDSFSDYGKFTGIRNTVIFGGVSQAAQTHAIRTGPEILVATPGRLLDLIGQGFIRLDDVRVFVLDEADRMLDMGFIHDMRKVIALLPKARQTLLFSATMPREITALADTILINPAKVEVTPVSSTVDLIDQSLYFVEKKDKKYLLNWLLQDEALESVLVFTRTKHGADKVVKDLAGAGILAQAIHGNKSQSARQLALQNFKSRKTRVLVATDIAARGIDVPEISHVINYEIPNIPETYVHRVGRTGRAGLAGTAISFCDIEEREYIRDIQKLISRKIPVVGEHPYKSDVPQEETRAGTPQAAPSRQPAQKSSPRPAQRPPQQRPPQTPGNRAMKDGRAANLSEDRAFSPRKDAEGLPGQDFLQSDRRKNPLFHSRPKY